MGEETEFIKITNRDIWTKLEVIENDMKDLGGTIRIQVTTGADINKRVRALELRFYGILAGLIGAIGTFVALILQGGE